MMLELLIEKLNLFLLYMHLVILIHIYSTYERIINMTIIVNVSIDSYCHGNQFPDQEFFYYHTV